MLRAMLLDAIQCVEGQGCPKRCRARLVVQARAWIVEDSSAAPFSFENVCAYLDLPADRLRKSVLRLAANGRGWCDQLAGARRRASGAEMRARAERNQSIRSLRDAGLRPSELAERFGLSYESIILICSSPHSARRAVA